MNFLDKVLDVGKALDLEKVAANAFTVVDEFPDRGKHGTEGASRVLVTSSASSKAKHVVTTWEELDLEGRKPEWEQLCDSLSNSKESTDPQQWEQRAKDAEYTLLQLCSTLISLPDPLPFLTSVAALSAKVVEVEAANRELQAAAEAAAADNKEVSALVEKHRALEAAHKELQDQVTKHEAEVQELRAQAATAGVAQQEAAAQAAEVARLQASLRQLREEHERTQSSLFESVAHREEQEGSRQRELDLAFEELERAHARVAELELQLRQQQQQRAASGEAAGAAAPAAREASGADAPSLSLHSDDFWERQLKLRSEQLAQAHQQLDQATRAAAEAQARHEAQLQAAANQVTAASITISKLQAELAQRADPKEFKELQARLEALQSLVDVQMEAEGWGKQQIKDAVRNITPQAAAELLQDRNRKLSSDLSTARREAGEQRAKVEELSSKLDSLTAELAKKAGLIRQLEEDLLAQTPGRGASSIRGAGSSATALLFQGDLASPTAAGAAAAAATAAGQGAAGAAGSDSADPAAAVSALPGAVQMPPTPGAADAGGSASSSLLDIVVSQRDRFRQRVTQLEEEKSQVAEELQKTRRQLDQCRADNVQLYEKVRYLERYSQKAAAGAGRSTVVRVDDAGVPLPSAQDADRKRMRYQCGPLAFEVGGGSREDGADAASSSALASAAAGGVRSRGGRKAQAFCFPDDGGDEEAGTTEGKYSRAYEARINPFNEFQRAEAEQRVRSLPAHDRAVLSGTKLLASSKFARAFLALYALLLHAFIMVLLYYAMSPRTRIEMVDMDALAQQQQAAVAVAAGSAVAAAGAPAAAAAAGAAATRALRAMVGRAAAALGGH